MVKFKIKLMVTQTRNCEDFCSNVCINVMQMVVTTAYVLCRRNRTCISKADDFQRRYKIKFISSLHFVSIICMQILLICKV